MKEKVNGGQGRDRRVFRADSAETRKRQMRGRTCSTKVGEVEFTSDTRLL